MLRLCLHCAHLHNHQRHQPSEQWKFLFYWKRDICIVSKAMKLIWQFRHNGCRLSSGIMMSVWCGITILRWLYKLPQRSDRWYASVKRNSLLRNFLCGTSLSVFSTLGTEKFFRSPQRFKTPEGKTSKLKNKGHELLLKAKWLLLMTCNNLITDHLY